MEITENVQPLCKECKNYSQWLWQNKNMKFCWRKRCTQFDCWLLKAKKECQGKFFDKNDLPKGNMKVVKMIEWNDAQKYPQCDDQNNFRDFWNCIRKFLVEKNIKINGSWHQNWEYGTPLIAYKGELYAFAVSMRRWGLIMAEAFNPKKRERLYYVDWAFGVPDGEDITVDENKDPSIVLTIEDKIKKLEAREMAVNNVFKNMSKSQKIAAKLIENLYGATKPELERFWPIFWKGVPVFIEEIIREIRKETDN
jgi:hypothetical protein